MHIGHFIGRIESYMKSNIVTSLQQRTSYHAVAEKKQNDEDSNHEHSC